MSGWRPRRTRRKCAADLSLLELASELSNVSRACKVMGYSRQQFYEIRRNFQTYGAEGLVDRLPGAKGPHPNRVPAEIEKAVLDHALSHPCHGALRVEQELRLRGLQVSSGGVRGVWQRHDLLTKHERLLRLEKATAERTIELTEEQMRLLERFSPEFRERHIEAPHTGSLVAVATFFVGTLKGVGKLYLQTAIDCHSRYAWARLYPSKLPVTAVHLMNGDVIPTFEATRPGSRRCCPTMAASSAAGQTSTPTNCSCNWRRSSTARPGSSGHNPTASSSASTARCSTSTSASRAAEPGSKPSRRCRLFSTTSSSATISTGPIRAAT
jgi:hypothetical protein